MDPASPYPAPKKGLPGVAIAILGCLGVIIVVAIAVLGLGAWMFRGLHRVYFDDPRKTAAMIALKANPDLEVVSSNDAAKEITVKNKRTGEVVTMSFGDVKNGKFSVKNAKGEEIVVNPSSGPNGSVIAKSANEEIFTGGSSEATKPPAWIPIYPSIKGHATAMRSVKDGKVSGAFSFETADAVEKVEHFYEGQLKNAGFHPETTKAGINGAGAAVIEARKEQQIVAVMISGGDGKTSVVLNYGGGP